MLEDFDGDGDDDLLAASQTSNRLALFDNRGGQSGIDSAGGDSLAPQGELALLLSTELRVNGRPGDSVGRADTLELEFFDTDGEDVLSSAAANALFDELRVYRDEDESGTFDPTLDTLVLTLPTLSLSGGALSVALPASEPSTVVARPATFFVVALMAPDAGDQGGRTLRTGPPQRQRSLRHRPTRRPASR